MVRTFNRQPLSVNVPDKKSIRPYFFNNYKWKGVINNKNFADVDQESFESCNNLYVSSDGLLRSRPSLKKQSIAIKDKTNNDIDLANIIDIWQFGDTTVYESEIGDNRYLTFVQNDVGYQTQLIFASGSNDKRVKLVVADRKIFIFTNGAFKYFGYDNSNTLGIYDAEDFIYIPTTSVTVNGIAQTDVETKNIMTDSELKKYIFDNAINYNFTDFIGNNYTLKIGNSEYEITFRQDSNLTFIDKYCSLNEDNFIGYDSGEPILGYGSVGYPLICASENGVTLISSYTYVMDNNTPVMTWRIKYTVNGIIFNDLPTIDNVIGVPQLSRNGFYAIVFKDDGPYIISIIATDNEDESKQYKYSFWTNLLKQVDDTTYQTWITNGFHLNTINSNGSYFNMTNQVNGYFIDDTRFAFTYADTLYNNAGDPTYTKLYCVYTHLDNDVPTLYKQNLFSNSSDFTIDEPNPEFGPPISVTYTPYCNKPGFVDYDGFAPNVFYFFDKISEKASIVINCILYLSSNDSHAVNGYASYKFHIERMSSSSVVFEKITYRKINSESGRDRLMKPIQSSEFTNGSYILIPDARINYVSGSGYLIRYFVSTYNIKSDGTIDLDNFVTPIIYNSSFDTESNIIDELSKVYLKLGVYSNYLLTNKYLFPYSVYTHDTYEPINLLNVEVNAEFKPVSLYYNGNSVNNIYLATDKTLYTLAKSFQLIEKISGNFNYIVPEYEAETDNYFISTDKTLYISKNIYDDGDFLWYFPKINVEEFDYKITNLHAISSSEVAIFTKDAIYYASYDKDVPGYRYYKSKVQVGLEDGADVITTFDGKYTIFASERGLVALSYQDFIASTEQSLTYISDNVYDNFYEYLHQTNNQVKLYKFAYWIICYNHHNSTGFVLDTRNMSWWPVSCSHIPVKFIDIHNEVKMLSNGYLLDLDTSDTNYYDYFGELSYDGEEKRLKIDWFFMSQKLYLSAINYYKHIVNMTFTSVHDLENLTDNDYNVDVLDFKLEIFNYRKKVDSNISFNGDFPIVTYNVNMARTFVQRLNFGKVNEFQYRISYDDRIDTSIEIPLSLNSITVKYKLGDMVR